MENAIRNMSVSDPSKATRAGVDPFTIWNNQRTRLLRANINNLHRAAGSREIRSRCGLATTTDRARGCGRPLGIEESGPYSYRPRGEEEDVEERAADSARRRKAAKEAVHSARDTVLRQNQKVKALSKNAVQYIADMWMRSDAVLASEPEGRNHPRLLCTVQLLVTCG